MANPRIWRARAASYSLVACALLSACGGGDSRAGGTTGDRVGGEKGETAALEHDEAIDTVVFHLTGLVLIVPPRTPGDSAHVVLPADMDHDSAWFGFGMGADSVNYVNEDLCKGGRYGNAARAAGICYVDLGRWSLAPFGAGGDQTHPSNQLPRGVVNVTQGSGGQHVLHVPWLTSQQYDARISFLAGKPGPDPCILAQWTYKPVGQTQGQPLDMVNVLDWVIVNPTRRELVFRDRSGVHQPITVPLPPADQHGKIELLLAHIPGSELEDLPPAQAGPPPPPPATAEHFRAYYNVLRKPGNPPEEVPADLQSRPVPQSAQPRPGPGCVVGITTTNDDKGFIYQPRALGTYACMVASGQGM